MQYRSLGRSGIKVSPLCIGTLNFGVATDEAEAVRIVHSALDAGINFFDTSDSYNSGDSERLLGKALADAARRQAAILATKLFAPTGPGPNDQGLSRRHIIRACEESLRRLGTDWIDLYQAHRPDPSTPIEETLEALTQLVHSGKVRYVGSTTHPAWMVLEAVLVAQQRNLVPYISEQPPYNLLDRRAENELVPLALKYGLGLLPWAPLAQGMLAGRYPVDAPLPADSRAVQRGGAYAQRISPRAVAAGQRFAELARARGFTPAQYALLWVKDQPAITAPVFGVRTFAQLQEVLPILDQVLTPDDQRLCDEINPPGTALADFYNTAGWMKMSLPA